MRDAATIAANKRWLAWLKSNNGKKAALISIGVSAYAKLRQPPP
jgi:hypothetical protein